MFAWIGLDAGADKKDTSHDARTRAEVEDAEVQMLEATLSHYESNPKNNPEQKHVREHKIKPHQEPIPTGLNANDAHLVIEALRRDLGSQREMLDEFYNKVEPMISHLKTLTENFDALRPGASLAASNNNFVSSVQFFETIADVKLELDLCKVALTKISGANVNNISEIVHEYVPASRGHPWQKNSAGNDWKDELNAYMTELRQEIARDYVRRDVFIASHSQVVEQSLNDAASLQDVLEASAERIRNSRAMNFCKENVPNPLAMKTALPPIQVQGSREGEMEITLHREVGSKLGLNLDGSDGKTLLIERIGVDGDITAWNSANPSQALKPGDCIVAINDSRGDSEKLIDEMSSSIASKMVLKVAACPTGNRRIIHLDDMQPGVRNNPILVKLPANRNGALGMSLKSGEDGILEIVNIAAGAVQSWNDNNPSMAVKSGDQLLSVNGARDSSVMVEQLKSGGEFSLLFMRN